MRKNSKKNRIKICLLGASFDTGNMGVTALAESSIKCILNRWPDAEIILLGSGYEPGQRHLSFAGKKVCVRTLPIRFSKNIFLAHHFLRFVLCGLLVRMLPSRWLKEALLNHNPCCRVLYETSLAVDITGGDSFSDIYGMRRFILGFLRKSLIKIFQKKLVFLPQTYGPFNKTVTKALARHILNNATVVYSRDRDGVDYVKKLLRTRDKNEKIRFLPDVGFVLDPRRPRNANVNSLEKIRALNRTLIGLNISGLLNRSSTGENLFNLKVDYPAVINSIVELLMKYSGTAVLLVPHVVVVARSEVSHDATAFRRGHEQSDVVACRKMYEQAIKKYNNRIFQVGDCYNHNEIKYVIGLCDFFIGSRMHACIAALSQCIPAVGLAYSKKFAGVFESAGVGELVVDLRRYGQDEIFASVRNAFEEREAITKHLRRTIPDVQAKILNIFTDFE